MIKLLLQLFISFFKLGLAAFGGGYAVIPLLHREAVEHRRWISDEELTDMMTLAQTMPGIIFVNSSTMVGYRVCGFWGALVATVSSITPTFILILVITVFLWEYTDFPVVNKIFTGILLGVTSLIIYSMTKMWKTVVKSRFDFFLALLSAVLLLVFRINVIFVILGLTVLGFSYNYFFIKSGENRT